MCRTNRSDSGYAVPGAWTTLTNGYSPVAESRYFCLRFVKPARRPKWLQFRRALIAAEPLGESPSRSGPLFLAELLRVLEPCLVVAGRRLDDQGRREAAWRKRGHGVKRQVIDETEVMFPFRADVDIADIAILMT